MGKKSRPAPPPVPDYAGIARQEADANQSNLASQTWANRPTINTPWGSQTWEATPGVDPATGKPITQWTSNVTLSPQQQAALDSQMAVQTGLSNQAQQFLNRVGESMGQPFDWGRIPAAASGLQPQLIGRGPFLQTSFHAGGPLTNQIGDAGGITRSFAGGGPLAYQIGDAGGLTRSFAGGGPLAYQIGDAGGLTRSFAGGGPLAYQIGDAGEVARGFAGGGPLRKFVGGSEQYVSQAGDALYNQARSRLDPQFQQRQSDLETALVNRGLSRGSEAWNRELDNFNRQRTDAYNDAAFRAAQLAGAEAARLQGMDIGAGEFQNRAVGQEFGQNAALAAFQNQAQQQVFGQLAQQAAFQNQAVGQEFGQNAALAQFQNQTQQQAFNQLAQQAAFQNQAAGQAFGQNAALAQFQNQTQQQAFNQLAQQAAFQNQAAGQAFGQNAALAGFQNQAQQQAFGQLAQQAAFQNQAAGQAFGQNAALAGFRNQALQNMFGNRLAASQQNFGQLQQQQEFQQRLRQQAIAEQQMARSQPLNELNALLTGQQVGMPPMPAFQAAGMAATPNMLGAANIGYGAQMNAYNAQLANQQNAQQGLFGAIGAAANIAKLFSDRRLKSRIHRIGTTARGTPLYIYNMHGRTQIGVLAQEAPPHAVIKIGGLLAVDYNEV